MNVLPKGWVVAPIETITTKPKQKIPKENENFSYIDIGSIDRGTKIISEPQKLIGKNAPSRARQLVNAGDVLVSMTRPNLNAVALVQDSLDGQIASTGFDVLRPLDIDPRYLFASVRTKDFVDAMSELVQGALYPAVRPHDIRKYEIPLAPLAEQKRISDKLYTFLARVQSTRTKLDRIPALLKRFRQSVLAAATSGELTEEWRGGGDVKWESVALEDVASDFSYGSAAKSAQTGRVPVMRMGNIQNGKFDWKDLVYTSNKIEIVKYKLTAGDVLFNRTNSPELVGKTAVFKGENEAIYAGYLIRVRCSEKLLPDFLSYCLNGPTGMHWRWEVKTDGVSQSNINATKLAALEIGLPPIEEQREIVHRVESLFAIADRIQKQYEIARAKVEKLTPALLAKAFRGELVPQDPSDEPAEKLLQRLRTNTQPAAKRGRKAKAA